MELPAQFQTFLANIEPTNEQKAQVSAAHATLRSRLREDCADHFKGSFLSGAYGRDTAIRTTKTVDIVVATNYSRSLWEPHLSLSQLKRLLSKDFKTITFQNGSIHISLSIVEIDVIPAIVEEGRLLVPSKDEHNWVLSNAHRHIQLNAAMDESKKGLYRPLVKALKCWRDHRMAQAWQPKSFLFECLIYNYAANSTFDSVPKAVESFLWYTYNKHKQFRETHESAPFIREIGAAEVNAAKNWSYQDFCNFMDETRHSWILSHQAMEAPSKIVTVDRWRQLFGDVFPADA